MNVGVIGLGSVGMFVAAQLSKAHKVTGYVRRLEQQELLERHGIIVDEQSFKMKVKLIEELSDHDLIIVCVKQTQIDELMSYIKRLSSSTVVLFLQNGLGHLEKTQNLVSKILVGTCDHGIIKVNDYKVLHKGKGQLKIASVKKNESDLAEQLIDEINQRYFPVEFHPQIFNVLYEKLIVNSVINPLTALFEVRNGGVVENPYINTLAVKLTQEASEVLSIDFDHAWETVKRVAEHTKDNYSSMLSDIQHNRKTEIDYINGYIIKFSNEPVPYHECIYNMIKAKEMR